MARCRPGRGRVELRLVASPWGDPGWSAGPFCSRSSRGRVACRGGRSPRRPCGRLDARRATSHASSRRGSVLCSTPRNEGSNWSSARGAGRYGRHPGTGNSPYRATPGRVHVASRRTTGRGPSIVRLGGSATPSRGETTPASAPRVPAAPPYGPYGCGRAAASRAPLLPHRGGAGRSR